MIPVQTIEVIGATVLEPEIDALIRPLAGKTVTVSELQSVTDAITGLYLERGFLTSRAVLVDESLNGDNVQIRAIEGMLERIEVEGAGRLNPDYIRSRVALGASPPLNVGRLEEQLRLLQTNPLFERVEATLKAGGEARSVLVIRVKGANPFKGSITLDNESPPSIGATRLSLDLAYLNLSGLGDAVTFSYRPRLEAFTGTYRLEFVYQLPLNPMDGSLQFRALYEPNKVIQEPFSSLDISGESQWYSVSFRQPIVRRLAEELALSIGFTYQQGQTFTFQGPTPFGFGPDALGISRTSAINFGQDYTLRDVSGAWAFRSQFDLGIGLLNATSNPAPIPDGSFISWLGQIQRVQAIARDHLLILQTDFQLTPDPLLPSQQFAIGGARSVRGYSQNARAGDNGIRFSAEHRFTFLRDKSGEPVLAIAPFLDIGYVWNAENNPNPQPPERFLAGIGTGLIWQPVRGMSVRIDYAPPLVYLPGRGNNIQDNGLYFSINYRF
jgi:hemolysin activation/secretion protein